jgi:hypothetical protein
MNAFFYTPSHPPFEPSRNGYGTTLNLPSRAREIKTDKTNEIRVKSTVASPHFFNNQPTQTDRRKPVGKKEQRRCCVYVLATQNSVFYLSAFPSGTNEKTIGAWRRERDAN